MTGQLDVDIIRPKGKVAVENITWSDKSKMKPGVYKFFVNQYSGSARNGFRAEIEFNGEIHSFDYSNSMMAGQDVHVDKKSRADCKSKRCNRENFKN